MSGVNNELAPNVDLIPVGTQAASIDLPMPKFRKHAKLKAVNYIDQAGIALDPTDFVQLSLQIGSTVLATLDTTAAAVTALVAKALTLAVSDIPAGSQLKLVLTIGGSGTTTLGLLQLEWFPY